MRILQLEEEEEVVQSWRELVGEVVQSWRELEEEVERCLKAQEDVEPGLAKVFCSPSENEIYLHPLWTNRRRLSRLSLR